MSNPAPGHQHQCDSHLCHNEIARTSRGWPPLDDCGDLIPTSGHQHASWDSIVAASVAQPRFLSQFVGVFAGLALILAAIGVYGVMAYSVAARTQEMGIRMSLGAERETIVKLVVGQGMRLALLGVAIGIAASLVLTRLISTLLYWSERHRPWPFRSQRWPCDDGAGRLLSPGAACHSR